MMLSGVLLRSQILPFDNLFDQLYVMVVYFGSPVHKSNHCQVLGSRLTS